MKATGYLLVFIGIGLSLFVTSCGKTPSQQAESSNPSLLSPKPNSLTIPDQVPKHLTFPFREKKFLSVTDSYGPLKIHFLENEKEIELPKTLEVKPWSAWWLPTKDRYLFEGDKPGNSPLEKYDLYMKKVHSRETHAAEFEKNNLHNRHASNWDGHCHAWALASLMEREPSKPVTLNDVVFGIGDLKALLIKSYEFVADGTQRYGQRYNGDRQSVYDDIYPDQFHRFVQVELFEKGKPFIIDKDPGVAVWNAPVYQALIKMQRDPLNAGLIHVDAWFSGASPFVEDYDYKGTLGVSFNYTYDLYGSPNPDGTIEIGYGVWTGKSLDYHPDFVTPMPEKIEPMSRNKELDPKIIEEILRSARQ